MMSDGDESADENENNEENIGNHDNVSSVTEMQAALNQIQLQQDFDWLKMAVVDESDENNMNSIKEKLISTMAYRLELIENAEVTSSKFNLLESFPYFFVCPELV